MKVRLLAKLHNCVTNKFPLQELGLIYKSYFGISSTLCFGYTNLIIEGYSQLSISLVNKGISTPQLILSILQDISYLDGQVHVQNFHHIYRETNFTADLGHSQP